MNRTIKLFFILTMVIALCIIFSGCLREAGKAEDQPSQNSGAKENFIPFYQIKLKSDLPGVTNKYLPYVYEKPAEAAIITGHYKLCSEQTDTINISYIGDTGECTLTINNVRKDIDIINFMGADVADFDINDKFKEIVLYADGPSGDPSLSIFRYDGRELYYLGFLNGNYKDDAKDIWADQKGKIYEPSQYICFVSPDFVTSYYTINDNKLQCIDQNIETLLNKKYIVNKDFVTCFYKTDNKDLENQTYDVDDCKTTIKKGETLIIIKADTKRQAFYVERENGEKGILDMKMSG